MKFKTHIRSFLTFPLASLFVSGLIVFLPTLAQATFPGKPVAHWPLNQSDEVKDLDFITVHKLIQQNKLERALNLLDIKSRSPKTQPTALILKAIILNDMNKPIRAFNLAKKAFLQESHHPAIQFAYCQIYRNLGKGNLSRRACTITAQQHPNSPETHYERAQILMALGEMKETLEELDKAIQLAPQVPQYHYEKGIIFTYFNDNIKAMGSFERALQIDQNHFDSAYQLAYILTTTGKVDKAKKYIDQILYTKETHAKKSSAKILADYIAKKSISQLPKQVDPHTYHKSRSEAFYKSKKYGLSLLEIQTANRLKPNDKKTLEILIGLSSILLRLDIAESATNLFLNKKLHNDFSLLLGHKFHYLIPALYL